MRSVVFLLLTCLMVRAQDEKKGEEERNEEVNHSLVLLLDKPRALDADSVAKLFRKTFGARQLEEAKPLHKERGEVFHVGEARKGIFMVSMKRGIFVLMRFAEPLFDAQIAAETKDQRVREAMLKEAASIHVRALHAEAAKTPAELRATYDDMGRLCQALWADDVVALYVMEAAHLTPAHKKLKAALGVKGVLSTLGADVPMPVMEVAHDAEMRAAIAKARKAWPQFLKAYRAKDGSGFQVKLRLSAKGRIEHVWILVTSIEGDHIEGRLGVHPVYLEKKKGDAIEGKVGELSDWAYYKDNRLVGAFTMDLILKRAKRAK